MKRTHQRILGATAIVLALAATAFAASYLTQESIEQKPTQQAKTVHHYQPTSYMAEQPAAAPCDDNNIVGTIGGGAAGGLVGSRFGKGNGKTAATVAGALGGAALGNKYIPTRGATCN